MIEQRSRRTSTNQSSPAKVRDSFALQGLMATLGGTLVSVAPGRVKIALAIAAEEASKT